MRPAISPERAEAVRRALADGMKQREIARRVGISVGTVSRIASGRWNDPDADSRLSLVLYDEPHLDARRCSGCGAMIYVWPCLRCHLEGAGSEDQGAGEP